jgi:hypothetical protein
MNNLLSLGTNLNLYIGRGISGRISQLLITKSIKYTSNFTPSKLLLESTNNNTLLYLSNNGYDIINNKLLTLNNIIIGANYFNPIILLNGTSIINLSLNSSYTELGATAVDYLNNNVNVIISGTVNTTALGTYIITYTATDIFNNKSIITRSINILQSVRTYTTNSGCLTMTGLNLNALNNVDWTCEIWLYMTANNSDNRSTIFDFRQPGTINNPSTHLWIAIANNKPIIQCISNQSYIGSTITTTVQFNKWTHVVWMRKNNIFYTFINGFASPGETVPSYLNSLAGLQYMTHGTFSDFVNSNSTYGTFFGQLCQPLISLGSKYNTSGFTPYWDLTPLNFTNVLYWLPYNKEIISNQIVTLNRTVVTNDIVSCPFVPTFTLNGSSIINIILNNTYTELGCTASCYLNENLPYTITGTVNTSVVGTYTLIYNLLYNVGTLTLIRTVFVQTIELPKSNLLFWIDPSDSTTINATNGNITSITDKSGNNIVMTNYVGTSKIKSNGIKNLSVLDFTNSSSLKSTSTYLNSINVTLAVIVVFFQNTNWGVIWGHFNNHDEDIVLRNTFNSNQINWHTNNDNTIVQMAYISSIPVLYIATLTNGTSRYFQMTNLTTGITTSISGTNPLTMVIANCPIYLGSSELVGELALCYVGECMYWTRVLSSTELTSVYAYLYSKWS